MGICQEPYYDKGVWCEYTVYRHEQTGDLRVSHQFKYSNLNEFMLRCSKMNNGDPDKSCPVCSAFDDLDVGPGSAAGGDPQDGSQWEILPPFEEVKYGGTRTVFTGMVKQGRCGPCPCDEASGGGGDDECKERLGDKFFCREDGRCGECYVDNDCEPPGKMRCRYGVCECKSGARKEACYQWPYAKWHDTNPNPHKIVHSYCILGPGLVYKWSDNHSTSRWIRECQGDQVCVEDEATGTASCVDP